MRSGASGSVKAKRRTPSKMRSSPPSVDSTRSTAKALGRGCTRSPAAPRATTAAEGTVDFVDTTHLVPLPGDRPRRRPPRKSSTISIVSFRDFRPKTASCSSCPNSKASMGERSAPRSNFRRAPRTIGFEPCEPASHPRFMASPPLRSRGIATSDLGPRCVAGSRWCLGSTSPPRRSRQHQDCSALSRSLRSRRRSASAASPSPSW